ncbi:MAG: 2-hydroxychromene-2-carboxylate isomerase [Rhodobacteraceae bacterium]|jgi:2-hydroxychromene-2-carboxylate isomerase|nr:2-hydroxychromene-2-carboxylate isomerase [Paracoccaceae bacterium]
MARIDYFFSTVSPWVYLSGRRLEGIAASHGATVAFRPVDPGALFARTGGLPVNERHPSRQAYRLQELRRWSAHLGTPLNLRPRHFPVNPAPSAYAVIAADRAGGGDLVGLIHGFSRAVWAEERDIADDAVVRDILAAHGHDPGLADRGLLVGAETYASNLEEAVARGVFGVPFCIVGDECFWGQDRLDFLDRHLAAGPA